MCVICVYFYCWSLVKGEFLPPFGADNKVIYLSIYLSIYPSIYLTLNDVQPIAMTSLVIKTLGKIVKSEIVNVTDSALDPLQFAYKVG